MSTTKQPSHPADDWPWSVWDAALGNDKTKSRVTTAATTVHGDHKSYFPAAAGIATGAPCLPGPVGQSADVEGYHRFPEWRRRTYATVGRLPSRWCSARPRGWHPPGFTPSKRPKDGAIPGLMCQSCQGSCCEMGLQMGVAGAQARRLVSSTSPVTTLAQIASKCYAPPPHILRAGRQPSVARSPLKSECRVSKRRPASHTQWPSPDPARRAVCRADEEETTRTISKSECQKMTAFSTLVRAAL